MVYNVSFIENATGFVQIAKGVNTESSGLLFGMILFFFALLVFMAFNKFDTTNVLLIDGFFTTLIAVLFFGMGLINVWVMVVCLIFLITMLIVKIW